MAKYSNTLEYRLRTTLDTSGVQKLQLELSKVKATLQNLSLNPVNTKAETAEIQKEIEAVKKLQTALNQSHNSKLGMLDLSKLHAQLTKGELEVNKLNAAFKRAGVAGTRMASDLVARMYKLDSGLKSISSATDKIMNTIGNTVRWGIVASGFSNVLNSIHRAADYAKELDKSLTDIMMVSGIAREEMNQYAKEANEVAERLGGTTVQMTEATKIFIQQGLSLQQSSKLGEYAVHLANVSGQESGEAADEITAYRNAFNISLEDMGNAISKWAVVANKSAVSVEELSVAAQKAASVAATVGVDLDQFAGHIAAIESVTREAPENIGNGLKTIYSRIADLNLGKTLEDEVNLGSFAKALEKVGVDVLDTSGKLRDAGTILEDLMGVWQNLDQTQQAAVAKTVAGRFQLARFEALMNRADIYQTASSASRAETGTETYDRMQATYRNSLEGRTKALQASVEEIFLNLFDTSNFYGMIDVVQKLVDTFNDLIQAIGGGDKALSAFGIIFTRIFTNQMARGINNFINNRERGSMQQLQLQTIQNRSQGLLAQHEIPIGEGTYAGQLDSTLAKAGRYATSMNQEQFEQLETRINGTTEAIIQLTEAEEQLKESQDLVNSSYKEFNAEGKTLAETLQDAGLRYQALQHSITAITEGGSERGVGQIRHLAETMRESAVHAGSLEKNYKHLSVEGGKARTTLRAQIDELQKWCINAGKSGKVTKEVSLEFQDMSYAINLASSALHSTKTSNQQSLDLVEKMISAISRYKQRIDELNTAATENIQIVGKQEAAYEVAKTIFDNQIKSVESFSDSMGRQNLIKGIISMSNAVTSAIWAFQSFGNVIDALNDKELTIGEKFEQILMNLGMALPMVISAVGQLGNTLGGVWLPTAIKNFKQLQQQSAAVANQQKAVMKAQQLVEFQTKKVEAAIREQTLATEQSEAAIKKETIATKQLELAKKQLKLAENNLTAAKKQARKEALLDSKLALSAGLTGAMIGVTIITSIITGIMSAQQEAYNRAKENLDKITSAYEDTKSKISNWDKAYEEYKKTGEVTDELKNAASDLNDTLDIQNGKVAELTGNYESLAKNMKAAAAEERSTTEMGYRSFLEGENRKSLSGEYLFNGSFYDDFTAPISQRSGQGLLDQTNWQQFYKDFSAARDEKDTLKQIGLAKQYVDTLNQEIADLDDKIAKHPVDEESLAKIRDGKLSLIADLQQVLNLDDVAQAWEAATNLASLRIESILEENPDITFEELQAKFEDDQEGLSAYIEALGGWTNALDFIIQNTNDEVLKTKLLLEQGLGDFRTSGGKILAEASSSGIIKGWDSRKLNEADVINGWIQEIQDSSLLDEEKLELVATLNEAESLDEILEVINNIETKSSDLLSLDLNVVNLTNTVDNSEEDLEQVRKDSNISENAFNRMSQSYYDDEDGFIQKERARLTEEINELTAKGNELTDEETKTLAGLRREYKGLADEAKDVVAANIKMNKGIADLKTNLEKYGEILNNAITDDSIKNTIEYYEALGEVDENLSNILNIDPGVLSESFYNTAENLELLQSAAEGDEAALDRLRNVASQDIIQNMKINIVDGEDAEATRAELLALQQELQNILDNTPLEARADVDVSEYTAKLNEMIKNGQITAEQASQALSSMGISGTLDYEEGVGKAPVVEYTTEGNINDFLSGKTKSIRMTSSVVAYKDVPMQVPVFKGTHYTGSGVTGVNSSNKSSGSGTGGGTGGGNNGSGKAPTKVDPAKSTKSEIDIYQKVNATLDKLQHKYEDIDRAKSKAWGPRYIAEGKKEIENLKKQNKVLAERNEISKKYMNALRTGQNDASIGVDFHGDDNFKDLGLTDRDLDGIVDNYKERYMHFHNAADAKRVEAENLRKAHNGELDEAQKEQYDNLIKEADALEEKAKAVNSVTQDYEKTWQDVEKTTEEVDKQLDQIEQLMISFYTNARKAAQELWKMRDAVIDTEEAWAKILQGSNVNTMGFAIDRLNAVFDNGDTAGLSKTAKAMRQKAKKTKNASLKAYYNEVAKSASTAAKDGTSQFNWSENNLAFIKDQLRQFRETGKSSIFGEDEEALMEAYQTSIEIVQDTIKEISERVDAIREAQSKSLSNIKKANDLYQKQYDILNNQVDHMTKMLELTLGETNTLKEKGALLEKQADIQTSNLRMLLQQQEEAHKTTQSLYDVNKDNLHQSEQYYEALEQEEEINEKILSTREEIAETYKKIRENDNQVAVQEWLKQFNQEVTYTDKDGNLHKVVVTLEQAANQWERIKENADLYLDDLNRAWETQKLQNKYQKLLNDTVDPSIQQKITQQMEKQLSYLREKDNLSKYDVEYANAQLEILQKTIALENARLNQNQMKLRRDTQGNYKYVYTADESDVSEKENDLLDAQMNAYNISVEASRNAQDQYFSKVQQMADAIMEVANNVNMNADEVAYATQCIIEDGYTFLEAMGEQLNESQKNGINSFIAAAEELSVNNAATVKDISKQLQEGVVDDLSIVTDTFHSAINDWINGDEGISAFRQAADQMHEDIVDNVENFVESVTSAADSVETPLSDISAGFDNLNTSISTVNNSMQNLFNFLEDESGIIKQGQTAIDEMQKRITAKDSELNKYYNLWKETAAEMERLQSENTALQKDNDDYRSGRKTAGQGTGAGKGSPPGGGNAQTGNGSLEIGDYVYYDGQSIGYENSYKQGRHWTINNVEGWYKVLNLNNGMTSLTDDQNNWWAWVENSHISGYDTGGYTGAWGTNGKLSILHEKELVLNKDDTENMLIAISALRDFVAGIKSASFSSSLGIRGASANNIEKTIEQRVEIKAEFPNVETAADIEAALLNISNDAYQYSYEQNNNRL